MAQPANAAFVAAQPALVVAEARKREAQEYFKREQWEAAIAAFKHNYLKLASGADLMIGEGSIWPVRSLPSYDDLTAEEPSLLAKTVVVKLNGGLGTGMGLEKAKSLLKVRGSDTFLDLIAKQVRVLMSSLAFII